MCLHALFSGFLVFSVGIDAYVIIFFLNTNEKNQPKKLQVIWTTSQ